MKGILYQGDVIYFFESSKKSKKKGARIFFSQLVNKTISESASNITSLCPLELRWRIRYYHAA